MDEEERLIYIILWSILRRSLKYTRGQKPREGVRGSDPVMTSTHQTPSHPSVQSLTVLLRQHFRTILFLHGDQMEDGTLGHTCESPDYSKRPRVCTNITFKMIENIL